jgi:hypothetical protein
MPALCMAEDTCNLADPNAVLRTEPGGFSTLCLLATNRPEELPRVELGDQSLGKLAAVCRPR